jgi:hypothetical protein
MRHTIFSPAIVQELHGHRYSLNLLAQIQISYICTIICNQDKFAVEFFAMPFEYVCLQ